MLRPALLSISGHSNVDIGLDVLLVVAQERRHAVVAFDSGAVQGVRQLCRSGRDVGQAAGRVDALG